MAPCSCFLDITTEDGYKQRLKKDIDFYELFIYRIYFRYINYGNDYLLGNGKANILYLTEKFLMFYSKF